MSCIRYITNLATHFILIYLDRDDVIKFYYYYYCIIIFWLTDCDLNQPNPVIIVFTSYWKFSLIVTYIFPTKSKNLGQKYYIFLPEVKRLMQVRRPAHLHSPTRLVLTIVPMKPSNAKTIPIEEMIWISNIRFLFSRPCTKS